jgi:hypothetical protein
METRSDSGKGHGYTETSADSGEGHGYTDARAAVVFFKWKSVWR